jgi:hypothetical protein
LLFLRNTIEFIFENKVRKRKAAIDETQAHETQEKFTKACKALLLGNEQNRAHNQAQHQQQHQPQRQRNQLFNALNNPSRLIKCSIFSFLTGLCIGLVLYAFSSIVTFCFWFINQSAYESEFMTDKYYKPVYLWTSKETYQWLLNLGPWSSNMIAPVSLKINLSKNNRNQGKIICFGIFYELFFLFQRLFCLKKLNISHPIGKFCDFWPRIMWNVKNKVNSLFMI